ncbi:MAG: DUF4860 domain-containing protein [Agathobacter sp.]|uniref:DUF4860 domain-containing protein n=1 Tax=Agathobacter sp. TaxID=2021311 RepID=UPI002588E5AD|nr:DUF4860 domain-containing protein [Agathobacter sp.]MCR5678459.1 DUF4860 domain-containing protein [Agathobacter sp.]
MKRIRSSSRKIDTAFAVLLFAVFAAIAILVVLLVAKQYKITTEVMEKDYRTRTANSYLREIVHQHDKAGSISVDEFSGTSALRFTEEVNGYTIHTFVYCYDGYICELTSVNDAAVSLDSGTQLIPAKSLVPELVDDDLLKISYTDEEGISRNLFIKLNCPTGKEAS